MTVIGIDVSKHKLDCAWLRDQARRKVKTKVFDNSSAGVRALIEWTRTSTGAPIDEQHYVLEATGVYHEALAYALYQAGARVSVLNPAHVHYYAQGLGRRSKTDKKDSVILALYGATQQPRLWQPEPENIRVLKALTGRLEALEQDIQRERNRLEKAQFQLDCQPLSQSIHAVLKHLESEKKRLIQQIEQHIDQDPDLKNDRQWLSSVPGVGPVLTRYMISLLRSRQFRSARQASAYAGLVPMHNESGSSVRGPARISKAGKASVRAKLYMAAVVATQHNPDVRALYQRLLKNGKSKMVALVAAMRKLIHICFGVLKNRRPFQAQSSI